MKLVSIGKSSRAQLVLDSPYVSSYHAELFLLDNGDMLLVDKGSSNGTFVNGIRIEPEKEVSVTRQDQIQIADQPLNWSSIPVLSMPDRDQIKVLMSIGSHYLNTNPLQGDMVSRFHATIKQMKDGKWFISDHSSNGTTVNGVRIPKDQYVRLNKGDVIACAGVHVANPADQGGASSPVMKYVAIAVAAVVVLGVAVWALMGLGGGTTADKVYEKYASTTAVLEVAYYLQVTAPDGDVLTLGNDGEPYNGQNAWCANGTGLFLSQDGLLVTNLHLIKPWLYPSADSEDEKMISRILRLFSDDNIVSLTSLKIESVFSYILAYPNGVYYDSTNAVRCRVVVEPPKGEDPDFDLVVLQTINGKLPEHAGFVPVDQISIENSPVGSKVYTMGFPMIHILQDVNARPELQKKPLQATVAEGVVTQNNDRYEYGYSANAAAGASGSPVFDSHGNLIGIVASGVTHTQGYNQCVRAGYIQKLLKADQNPF